MSKGVSLNQSYQPYSELTKQQCSDSALALLFIIVLLTRFTAIVSSPVAINALALGLVIALLIPGVYKPFAWGWFNLSVIMGTVMSKVILTILFYGFIYPLGIVVRLFSKDPMRLNQWKKTGSVYIDRDELIMKETIIKPY